MQDRAFVQCGREIATSEIEKIHSTVADLKGLSRSNIIEAVCEEVGWFAATGAYKVEACTKLLGKLEAEGIIKLPGKRGPGGRPHRKPKTTQPEESLMQGLDVAGRLGDIGPVSLELVEDEAEVLNCNALVARYHYLGCHKKVK